MRDLTPILDWKMTSQEAEAYKIAILWEEQTNKIFPGIKLAKLSSKGDPRKSNLFKHCWQMARETRGLLREEEYKLYVIANLQILNIYKARIEPNILCGEKAWVRWKVWKRLYDAKLGEGEKTSIQPKISNELAKTKHFLFNKFAGQPTFEQIKTLLTKGIQIWVGNKISIYYLLLSPWVKKIISAETLEQKYGFDKNLYQTDEAIREYFKKEFVYEF